MAGVIEPGAASPGADLAALCARAFARDPAAPAIFYDGRWHEWGKLRGLADRIAELMARAELPSGLPVAFIPRNRPSAVAALLKLVEQQRSVAMIYAFQSAEGMARDIMRVRPGIVLLAAEDVSDPVRAALAETGAAGLVIGEDDVRLVDGHDRVACRATPGDEAPPHIAILTSGTTGPPKQFPVSYEMLANHMVGASAALASDDMPDGAASPPLLFFPLGNISGLYTTLPAMLKGWRAELVDRFTIEAWHQHVLRFRPVHSGLPPAMIQMVLDQDIPKEDLASLQALGTGAAPLDPVVQRAFQDRYGIPVLLSYGATEFGGPVAAMTKRLHDDYGEAKFGSVGRPFGGAEIRVVDPETGVPLPPGQEGQLEVISPRIGPEWIRTSDIAIVDEDGFLFHRGRADGAIIRGGFKLVPEVIERALMLHPAIAAVSIVPVPDRRLGQLPAAAIQFKRGESAALTDIEHHLRTHVPATHIPARWLIVDDLPKTPSMKIDRPGVIRMFE